MHQPQRILVIAIQGLGNVLLATPLLHSLRQGLPVARIDVLVLRNGSDEALAENSDVDDVLVAEKTGIRGALSLAAILRARRYDTAVVAWPGGLRSALLAFLSGARLRLGHPQPTRGFRMLPFLYNRALPLEGHKHDLERNLELAAALGVEPAAPVLRLPLTDADRLFADRFVEHAGVASRILVGLHPGSGATMAYKRWPPERFAALGDALARQLGASVLLFGGPGERSLMQQVAGPMEQPPLLAPEASVRETASLAAKCHLFISNDSGLMHVAVAAGVPTIGVFGPTDHRRTAPYGPLSRIVRADLTCSPCFRFQRGGFQCPRERECLVGLTEDVVMDAAVDLLARSYDRESSGALRVQ